MIGMKGENRHVSPGRGVAQKKLTRTMMQDEKDARVSATSSDDSFAQARAAKKPKLESLNATYEMDPEATLKTEGQTKKLGIFGFLNKSKKMSQSSNNLRFESTSLHIPSDSNRPLGSAAHS